MLFMCKAEFRQTKLSTPPDSIWVECGCRPPKAKTNQRELLFEIAAAERAVAPVVP
jgi:hypothetical protein